jgi:mannosyl-oligosaccharide alpha-1,2-mannosidase
MAMDQWAEGSRAEGWLHHVDEWEKAGRPGDVPPGVREVPPESQGNRDYQARKSAYLLRPEVRVLPPCMILGS